MGNNTIKGHTLHPMDERVAESTAKELGERKFLVSATDHNQKHLLKACLRDKAFKKELSKVLDEGEAQKPLVILYERDPKIFLVGCRYHVRMRSTKFLQGEQYVALLESEESVLVLTLFKTT